MRWVAKPGAEGRVAEILEALVPASRAEPGTLRYEVFRVADDPRSFILVEAYESAEALEAHAVSTHVQELVLDEALALLEERARTYLEPL